MSQRVRIHIFTPNKRIFVYVSFVLLSVIYSRRYAIRTSQRVRTHSFIHTYCTGDPLVPLHTYVPGTSTYPIYWYLQVYSPWNELVPACNASSGLNFPLAVRAHITTKLYELKTALDAGRGGWRKNKGPPQPPSRPKSMVYRGRSRDKAQCTHRQTDRQRGSKNNFY